MLSVIRDLAKSRSIISVITRSSNTWTCNIGVVTPLKSCPRGRGLKKETVAVKGAQGSYKNLHLGIGILNRSMVETVVRWNNHLISKEKKQLEMRGNCTF